MPQEKYSFTVIQVYIHVVAIQALLASSQLGDIQTWKIQVREACTEQNTKSPPRRKSIKDGMNAATTAQAAQTTHRPTHVSAAAWTRTPPYPLHVQHSKAPPEG